MYILRSISRTDPGFQVRGGGGHKKIAPSEGRIENVWGILCEKSRFDAKKIIFFQFFFVGGGGRRPAVFKYLTFLFIDL
jgi:hypothetical protein